MIFRAIVCIGLVALVIAHEHNLGFSPSSAATASISGASERSASTRADFARTRSYACRVSGPVLSGANKSRPWHAERSSIASTLRRFASIGSSLRAAPIPIDT